MSRPVWTVGDEVTVRETWHRGGAVEKAGVVTKVGRSLVTVKYGEGKWHHETQFRMDSGAHNDPRAGTISIWAETNAMRAERLRGEAAVERLARHRTTLSHQYRNLPAWKLERLADLLDADHEEPADVDD